MTLHSEDELDTATARVDALLSTDCTCAEGRELELLSDAIERYEEIHHPIPKVPPAEVLGILMAAASVDAAGLSSASGVPEVVIADVMNGRRVSRRKLVPLARHFSMSVDSFLPVGGGG